MITHLRPALVMIVLMTVLTGLAYPLAMTGLAGAPFPRQAAGSFVERDGKIVGSSLIGQNSVGDAYFHSRPSATTTADPNDSAKTVAAPYNAANSSGSNLASSARALIDRAKEDVAKLKSENPGIAVPADLVTTSGSGLDPDISPGAAPFQAARVARARGVPEATAMALVAAHTQGRLLGILGEPRVNVLALNLALNDLRK